MIIDLPAFVAAEQPYWTELEGCLDRLERDPAQRLPLEEVRRFYYLYERASADLARLATFSAEPQTRRYLETLVARAYGEIHENRSRQLAFSPWKWFSRTLPQTFRRHAAAWWVSVAVTLAGALFGAAALQLDPEAKRVLMPFPHLQQDPARRVAQEESGTVDRLGGQRSTFSASLMTHNTRVAILAMALGMTWGAGTIVLLFYNGVIIGAVAVDYIRAGQTSFLFGWLLPHGAIEIPAFLIAGQAGLVLAAALIGRRRRETLGQRLRHATPDVVTLVGGVALLLVWAGFIESFLSQYHEPVLPYVVKIGFGITEIVLLALFLMRAGRSGEPAEGRK